MLNFKVGEQGKAMVEKTPEPQERNSWQILVFGPRPLRTFGRVLLWSLLVFGLFHNLLVPIQIIGSSMSPTYQSGSLNFVNKLSYAAEDPIRGDVVALRADGELLLKRIVGMPGEVVSIESGEVRINGVPLADEFSRYPVPWHLQPVPLGLDEYFVIGDNRSASVFGRINEDQILGKLVF